MGIGYRAVQTVNAIYWCLSFKFNADSTAFKLSLNGYWQKNYLHIVPHNLYQTFQLLPHRHSIALEKGPKCTHALVCHVSITAESDEYLTTAVTPVEITHVNASTLTFIASEICWRGSDCRSSSKVLGPVQWEPGQNSRLLQVQAFPSRQQEYYLEFLPSCCPPLPCLYCGLLIVWQDWQAPWQSWLKALRSEKWDRYRANTCLLAVRQSPTGCFLHWRRINGYIKSQHGHFSPPPATLPSKQRFTWLLFLVVLPSPFLAVVSKLENAVLS